MAALRDEIARSVMRQLRAARDVFKATADAGQSRRINVRHPRNVVITTNVGGHGSTHATSTSQTVRIRQDGTAVSEESETIQRRSTRE
jgi:hypothetical protein